MAGKLLISETIIQARASNKVFTRGYNYYSSESVKSTIQRGHEIEALCQGSYPQPYRVRAELGDHQIISASCSCEYDWGGDCKHIVAMLLTYMHNPELFEEKLPTEAKLTALDKDALISIIQQMLNRYPDLYDIIARPIPSGNTSGEITADLDAISRELSQSFQNPEWQDYGYIYESGVGDKIFELINVGKRFEDIGDYNNAIVIYCTILEKCNQCDEYIAQTNDFSEATNHLIETLYKAINAIDIFSKDNLRQKVSDALLNAFIADINFGGYDYAYQSTDILLEILQPQDIIGIRAKIDVEKKLKATASYGRWAIEAYERFLIDLDAISEADPEETLKRLAEEGYDFLLFRKLLELDRLSEAIDVMMEKLSMKREFTKALTLLKSKNHLDIATQKAEEVLASRYDDFVANWLISQFQQSNDHESELRWQLVRMKHHSSINNYIELKQVASKVGKWKIIHSEVLQNLTQRREWNVLVLIYLQEEAWDDAWTTLNKIPDIDRNYAYIGAYTLDFNVAKHTLITHHKRALPIYMKYIYSDIEQRKRGNYAHAAQLLKEVKQAYHKLQKGKKWQELITHIRKEFKRLPALQDELNKAGL